MNPGHAHNRKGYSVRHAHARSQRGRVNPSQRPPMRLRIRCICMHRPTSYRGAFGVFGAFGGGCSSDPGRAEWYRRKPVACTGRTPIQVDRNPGGLRARPVPSEMRVVRRWSASQGYAHRTTSPASRGCASARCSTAAARASPFLLPSFFRRVNMSLSCAGRSAQSSCSRWEVSAT